MRPVKDKLRREQDWAGMPQTRRRREDVSTRSVGRCGAKTALGGVACWSEMARLWSQPPHSVLAVPSRKWRRRLKAQHCGGRLRGSHL